MNLGELVVANEGHDEATTKDERVRLVVYDLPSRLQEDLHGFEC